MAYYKQHRREIAPSFGKCPWCAGQRLEKQPHVPVYLCMDCGWMGQHHKIGLFGESEACRVTPDEYDEYPRFPTSWPECSAAMRAALDPDVEMIQEREDNEEPNSEKHDDEEESCAKSGSR